MKRVWLIGFLAVVVLISGCTSKTETQPVVTQNVEIKGFAFNPETITISKGTTVTWTQKDSAPHTVTGINSAFSSDTLSQGQTFSYTFNETGTFEYNCHIHPNMQGKVIVT